MKKFYLQNTVSKQNPEVSTDTCSGSFQTYRWVPPKSDLPNNFLIQNKGKGPPGRQRSPGVGNGLFPDHPPDDIFIPGRVQNPVRDGTSHKQPLKIRQLAELYINTEYKYFITITKHNFLTIKFLQS